LGDSDISAPCDICSKQKLTVQNKAHHDNRLIRLGEEKIKLFESDQKPSFISSIPSNIRPVENVDEVEGSSFKRAKLNQDPIASNLQSIAREVEVKQWSTSILMDLLLLKKNSVNDCGKFCLLCVYNGVYENFDHDTQYHKSFSELCVVCGFTGHFYRECRVKRAKIIRRDLCWTCLVRKPDNWASTNLKNTQVHSFKECDDRWSKQRKILLACDIYWFLFLGLNDWIKECGYLNFQDLKMRISSTGVDLFLAKVMWKSKKNIIVS
jgi:hypothetical protein